MVVSPDTAFAAAVLDWSDRHGRKDLPWKQPPYPYRVWVSEIMLQQTRVQTVLGYFQRFMDRFPDVVSLADAPLDEVLTLWSGLGYYARGRNLHAAARRIRDQHGGVFPQHMDALQALPGIGRSTAGAIAAQAFGQRQAILDGNVKRLLARHDLVEGWPGEGRVQKRLWALAEQRTPRQRVADYTQGVMDLGAIVCTRGKPLCDMCPLQAGCLAKAAKRIQYLPMHSIAIPNPIAGFVQCHQARAGPQTKMAEGVCDPIQSGRFACVPAQPPQAPILGGFPRIQFRKRP